ncbi:PAS domain-containing protein [Sulfitobacter sp. SK012]|uniref:PAS domain-containing protein n=1 Tax=Sulfitobacter sp. SK012 TaxID=1389005 RepID=UPI000E0C3FFB|nr:PAS domain-containing protein [Sulfitobacter sp. SK012]AXI46566.1 PAS domain-containing protein [Sulfitobacter sp. SK012]
MDNLGQKAQNVISMGSFQTDTGFAALAQVEAYWEALRGTRLMPRRAEIDPRGIEQVLEYAFIVERIAPGIARLRVAGSHLSDIMGMEVRGMPLTSFFAPSARRRVSDMLEEVFETPAQSTLKLTSELEHGRPPLEARMLLLPLKSDLGDVSRILGCLVAQGDLGTTPRRFDITTSDLRTITAGNGEGVMPAPQPSKKQPVPQPMLHGMAEAPAGFEGKAIGNRRPPYLRLVKSDD